MTAAPSPALSANATGIVGLAQSLDRHSAQRVARDWVDAVLSRNLQQLREMIVDTSPRAERERLAQQWALRGAYQQNRNRDEVFDAETVKIVEHDAEALLLGGTAVVFEVKFDGAPMTRSYMPRSAQTSVRLVLVQVGDGRLKIAISRDP